MPVACVTERSQITVVVWSKEGKQEFDDWTVLEVIRPKGETVSSFTAKYTSEKIRSYKFQEGDSIQIIVTPVIESPDNTIIYKFNAVNSKDVLPFVIINEIMFEKE